MKTGPGRSTMRRVLRRAALPAVAAATLTAGPAGAASIWTEIPSGTTSTITAIEYLGAGRMWYGTAAGEIYRRRPDGSGFDQVRPGSARAIRDIEFSGDVGFAVGDSGLVYRSTDGGITWQDVNPPATRIVVSSNRSDGRCLNDAYLENVYFVRFTAPNRVYIGSTGRRLARSQGTPPGSAGTWQNANDGPGDECVIRDGRDGFFDIAPTSNTDIFYLLGSGKVFKTTDNLAGTPIDKGFATDAAGDGGRLAIDPGDPNRLWGVRDGQRGNYTENGFDTRASWFRERGYAWPSSGVMDVDHAGGTVLAAGRAGTILNSIDGRDFYRVSAEGALESREWRAVSLASATDGAAGGSDGKLVVTSSANRIPDLVSPEGSIGGPSSVPAGAPATFTADVSDAGDGIDPDGFSWTATDLPPQTGQAVTVTFPRPGFYTLRVTFRDRAGNAGTATKTVNVGSAPAITPTPVATPHRPATPPVPMLPAASRPPATATRRGAYVVVRIRGGFRLPAGVSAASACRGRVFFTVFKRKRPLRHGKGALSSRCRFAKTLRVPRSRVATARRLTVRVRFFGNTALRAAQRDYAVRVRRG